MDLIGIDNVMEVVCAFFSLLAITIFIVGVSCICKRGITLEKNLIMVLVIEGLAIAMKSSYNFMSIYYKFNDESSNLKFAMWSLQMKSIGIQHLAFLIIIAKIFALLVAFSHRRLSKSLDSIKKSNTIILYLSIISFLVIMANDISILIYYLINKNDETWQSKEGYRIVRLNLIQLMVGGCFNVFVLFLLWPMTRMFKKAIHLQKMKDHFSKKGFAKNSLLIFVICYVIRCLFEFVHAGWGIYEF